jgi:hypothetical protein
MYIILIFAVAFATPLFILPVLLFKLANFADRGKGD